MAKSKSKKKRLSLRQRRTLEGLMFVSPWIIGAILFFIEPIFVSIKLSFSEIVSQRGFIMEWVGLKYYKQIITGSQATFYLPMFLSVIKDTAINTPITLVFSLFIAILVNKDIKARGFFRTVFFIPVLLGSGYVMKQLLGIGVGNVVTNQVDGMLTANLLKTLGGTFATVVQDILGRITTVLWKSGVQIILFLAGLQGIPSSLYEASRCDGATEWENFWKITLPIVSPIILLNFIYTMVDSFTDSNNDIVSQLIGLFKKGGVRFSEGAAVGWIYFTFTFIICGIALWIMRKLTFNIGERE
jgi:ABC-type sugar transport system permease subunit